MLVKRMINKVVESYGIIKLLESSNEYLKNPTDFYITENHNYSGIK